MRLDSTRSRSCFATVLQNVYVLYLALRFPEIALRGSEFRLVNMRNVWGGPMSCRLCNNDSVEVCEFARRQIVMPKGVRKLLGRRAGPPIRCVRLGVILQHLAYVLPEFCSAQLQLNPDSQRSERP